MNCDHGKRYRIACTQCQVARKLKELARYQQWPNLLANVVCGWSAPEGWNEALYKLCPLLERIGGVRCVQCKEKFGTLRFYIERDEGCTEEQWGQAHALIAACEAATETICQDCGGDGRLRRHSPWWRTRCDACEKADDR